MKKESYIFLFALVFGWGLFSCQEKSSVQKTKKAVFIIVDGIAEDMLKNTPTPHFDKIEAEGRFLKTYVGGGKGTYSETPTISAVGYNSLLTGTWFNKHEVFDNYNQSPNYNYPTLFQLLKAKFPDKKTGVFSTWEDNRTVLIGEGLDQTNNLKLDYVFDGYELDTLNYPHDSQSDYIRQIDSTVVQKAVETISKEAPDLSWVYLQYTDDVAHRNGNSEVLDQAITYEDALIGKIYDAVKLREKEHEEDWLFVVTTDHGRDSSGYHHGGQSERERNTWILLNKPSVNAYAKTQRVALVDLFPTIADHLEMEIPNSIKKEMDGVSLIKEIKAYGLKGEIKNNQLQLTWKSLEPGTTKAEILISETNNHKTGGKDDYRSLGEVDLKEEKFLEALPEDPSDFYKVILKYDNHMLNTWIEN